MVADHPRPIEQSNVIILLSQESCNEEIVAQIYKRELMLRSPHRLQTPKKKLVTDHATNQLDDQA